MRESVVLVHGLWMTGAEMALLRRRLRRCGFPTYQFHYHSLTRDLEANVERLARFVEKVPGERVHFVAHSLGGLLVRELFRSGPPARGGRVVALGTPFRGSAVARRLCRSRAGRWLLGRSAPALIAPLPEEGGARAIGSIAGDLALGFGRLLSVLAGPNDGTVAVEETQLPGAAHLVLPVSHTGILTAASVAAATCHFLHHGTFASRERGNP